MKNMIRNMTDSLLNVPPPFFETKFQNNIPGCNSHILLGQSPFPNLYYSD